MPSHHNEFPGIWQWPARWAARIRYSEIARAIAVGLLVWVALMAGLIGLLLVLA